eukprot:m.68919 g.68919  ORF g.68919 m.68919 type:complete len:147 (-) comp24016_c0_seq1:98-538(-)
MHTINEDPVDTLGDVEPRMLAVVDTVAVHERLAEEIITGKHQVVELDRRRNENRMALREIKKKTLSKASKIWMNVGDIFLQLPRKTVVEMMEKDQTQLDTAIDETRDNLQKKAVELRQKEHKPISEGWDLKGMSFKEMSGSGLNMN